MTKNAVVRSSPHRICTNAIRYDAVRLHQPADIVAVPLIRTASTKGSSDPSSGRTVLSLSIGVVRGTIRDNRVARHHHGQSPDLLRIGGPRIGEIEQHSDNLKLASRRAFTRGPSAALSLSISALSQTFRIAVPTSGTTVIVQTLLMLGFAMRSALKLVLSPHPARPSWRQDQPAMDRAKRPPWVPSRPGISRLLARMQVHGLARAVVRIGPEIFGRGFHQFPWSFENE